MKKKIILCLISFVMGMAFAQKSIYAPLYIGDEKNMLFHDGKDFYEVAAGKKNSGSKSICNSMG